MDLVDNSKSGGRKSLNLSRPLRRDSRAVGFGTGLFGLPASFVRSQPRLLGLLTGSFRYDSRAVGFGTGLFGLPASFVRS
jgi:hypothetical protein